MIPRDYITEWRSQVRWLTDAQVEQDLVLSRAIVELFSQTKLARSLAFRGATALYKLHLRPAARYSEDMIWCRFFPNPSAQHLTQFGLSLIPGSGHRGDSSTKGE